MKRIICRETPHPGAERDGRGEAGQDVLELPRGVAGSSGLELGGAWMAGGIGCATLQ